MTPSHISPSDYWRRSSSDFLHERRRGIFTKTWNFHFRVTRRSAQWSESHARRQSSGWDRQIKPTRNFFFFLSELNMVAIRRPELFFVWYMLKKSAAASYQEVGKKGGYFKTIYVILTAAALSWITLMQRFRGADWISPPINFQIFVVLFFSSFLNPQFRVKDLFPICLCR